jgi:putative ABC transport system ATP-binding protein
VFQGFNLLKRYTALENVALPLVYSGMSPFKRRAKAVQMLELVGLGDRVGHLPNQLSGGQQQRVAIARSLVNDPFFLLADEATGNLDSVTAEEILLLLRRLNDEGRTIIMVTHEDDVAATAKRIIRLRDGLVQSDQTNDHRRTPELRRPAQPAEEWQAA